TPPVTPPCRGPLCRRGSPPSPLVLFLGWPCFVAAPRGPVVLVVWVLCRRSVIVPLVVVAGWGSLLLGGVVVAGWGRCCWVGSSLLVVARVVARMVWWWWSWLRPRPGPTLVVVRLSSSSVVAPSSLLLLVPSSPRPLVAWSPGPLVAVWWCRLAVPPDGPRRSSPGRLAPVSSRGWSHPS